MREEAGDYGDFFNAQNEPEALFARTLEGMLKAEGITVPQAFALKTLKEQGVACKMSDLAAMRLQSPASRRREDVEPSRELRRPGTR